ncbi:MAG: SlyX family protein [Treponema sp.]|jgi:uncharacterized coiled-coil protein SlyX|nr:SlyX family protein [Treponema sp.]
MINQSEIEERFERLEIKLVYMEDILLRLQEETLSQNQDFDRLKGEHEAVKERLRQLSRDFEAVPQTKPPHY